MKFTLDKEQISVIIEALQQEDSKQSNDLINYIENQIIYQENNEIDITSKLQLN